MKKGADSTGQVMHVWKSGWWFVLRKIRVVELWWHTYITFISDNEVYNTPHIKHHTDA